MNLQALIEDYQLGDFINSQPLPGGTMHHTQTVKTTTGHYLVKTLNQSLMQFSDYETTESIAREAKSQGFPARTALLHQHKSVYWQGDDAFAVYPFIDANHLPTTQLTAQHIQRLAALSAQLHGLSLQTPNAPKMTRFVTTETEWQTHLAGFEKWLSHRIPSFLEIQAQYDESFHRLSQTTVITHRDFTPANCLWPSINNPVIIDWELAGYMNPSLEVLHNAIDVAICDDALLTDPIFTYIKAYRAINHTLSADPKDCILACLASWIHWILFCLKRQNDPFKPLPTEKMIKKSLIVIDFLTENRKTVEFALLG